MTPAAIEARVMTLARLERAAGTAFGCEQDRSSMDRAPFVTPTTLALAAFATALAGTIAYLV